MPKIIDRILTPVRNHFEKVNSIPKQRVRIEQREDGRFILIDADTGFPAFKNEIRFYDYYSARRCAEDWNGLEVVDE